MLSRCLPSLVCALALAGSPAIAADAPAAPDSGDLSHQLAETQDKLSAALRSYTIIQDENDRLKTDLDKAGADKAALAAQLDDARREISGLKALAAEASQLGALRTQLRQSRDEAAALAAENARLRTLLALRSPSPSSQPTPTRPAP